MVQIKVDETSLNYKMLPSETLAAKIDRGSWSKEVQRMHDCSNVR